MPSALRKTMETVVSMILLLCVLHHNNRFMQTPGEVRHERQYVIKTKESQQ